MRLISNIKQFMSKLILPRVDENGDYYISYSQLDTWKRSKREYIRRYFFGEKFEGNAYTDFGTKIGEALENNDFSEFSADEQEFLKKIPRYGEYEREVRLEMKGFYVKGFIDTSSPPTAGEGSPNSWVERIADYKTGDITKKTAEYESDDYTQVDIYAAAIRQEFGFLPNTTGVYLIHRTGNAFKGGELKLGNKCKWIPKNTTDERADQVLEEVQKLAEDISEYYQVFLKALA